MYDTHVHVHLCIGVRGALSHACVHEGQADVESHPHHSLPYMLRQGLPGNLHLSVDASGPPDCLFASQVLGLCVHHRV